MRALLYSAFDRLEAVDLPRPEPQPDEVLLRVSACGICGSELESFRHRSPRRAPPLVLGHEFCGVVESAGPAARRFRAGDRVAANALVACGSCPSCRRGDDHVCPHRQLFGMHRPGAFAEFVAVPERSLIPWPESLPAEAACLAEPLGNGVHMVGLTAALAPKSVLVIGAGPIGLLALQAFRAIVGARVIVADLAPDRLKLARELGAEHTLEAGCEDVVAGAQAATGGEGVDVVIDAVGIERTKLQSLAAVRPAGAVVWIGLGQDAIRLASFGITLREIQVHGTYGAKIDDLRVALGLLASGAISTHGWTKTSDLADGQALFRRMLAAQGDDIKGVLLP